VSASTTRLSRPHQDTEAEQRCFPDLERELRILVDGWA
jgi:hypothetical protein